ncbi:M23 family metallopeptidase [Nocardioides speluncae]|uniref:M23 family metallopeptidase n=1 Tax=Nocardioides speluncae TaxID=2670337 RepID=UPI000D69B098|nr:M23 family metallopeptidase [Nocardioides speluncae]
MNDIHHRLTQAADDEGVPLRTDFPDLLRRARADRRSHRTRVSLAAAATTAVVLAGGGFGLQALASSGGAAPDPAQAPSKSAAAEPRQGEPWVLPVDSYRITNTFGMEGGYYSSGFHAGLDFATSYGTPIKAITAGKITAVGYQGEAGNRIVLKLEDGTELRFHHLSAFEVEKGDRVRTGQVIGYVGSTGNSFGDHVHLEVRPDGRKPLDPVKVLAEHGVHVNAPKSRPPGRPEAPSGQTTDKAQWVRPVEGCRIGDTFGQRQDYYSSGYHTGLDFKCKYGKPIKAVTAGKVTAAGYKGAYGNRVVIQLKDGTELWFAHMSGFEVKKGDRVRAGQVIGYVGSTGNSVVPHLHLEVRPGGGDPVDPAHALAQHGVKVDLSD